MKLAEHFTLGEMTKTSTGLANEPNEAQVKNLMRLCGWLEMLRDEWNKRYSLPPFNGLYTPFGSPVNGGRKPSERGGKPLPQPLSEREGRPSGWRSF